MQLEIEREALRRETDSASKERLEKLESELESLCSKQDLPMSQMEKKKGGINRLRELKEHLENARRDMEEAERQYDLNRSASLRCGTIQQIEKELKEAE